MKLILGTNIYTGKPLEIVTNEVPEGFTYHMLEERTEECLIRMAADADYILAGGRLKISEAVLRNAPHLKMIQRSGVGLDSLDLEAIKKRGIPLYVNQGVNTESVAEHTLMLILACLRRLTVIHRNTAGGTWSKQEQGVQTAELRGKTVGIIGMGNSGQALAQLLQPFRVKILYNSRSRKEDVEKKFGAQYATLKELLAESDIISTNCSLNPETAGIINSESIGLMKQGAILVNTARGGLVDTEALAEGLKSGKISFAGIDVYETEPIPHNYPLRQLDNVILTPHIAGITEDSFRAMMHGAFRNINCFENGRLEEIAPYRYL